MVGCHTPFLVYERRYVGLIDEEDVETCLLRWQIRPNGRLSFDAGIKRVLVIVMCVKSRAIV